MSTTTAFFNAPWKTNLEQIKARTELAAIYKYHELKSERAYPDDTKYGLMALLPPQERFAHLRVHNLISRTQEAPRHLPQRIFEILSPGLESFDNFIKFLNTEHFTGAALQFQGAKELKQLAVCPQLEYLRMDDYFFDKNPDVSGLLNFNHLRALVLSRCLHYGNDVFKIVQQLQQLQYFAVYHSKRFTQKGLNALNHLSQLVHLELNGIEKFKDESLRSFLNCQQLMYLDLLDLPLLSGETLADLAELPYLHSLKLGSNKRLKSLKGLEQCQSLRRLEIHHCPLGNEAWEQLLPLPYLQGLNISSCRISKAGFEALSHLKQVQELFLLNLKNLSDGNLKYIGQMKSLKFLRVQACGRLSEKGLKHLYGLNLEYLDFVAHDFEPAALHELQNALPDCKIHLRGKAWTTSKI